MEELDGAPPLEVDPYQVLEIETSATANEVKSAYKKLALRHHPDKALPDQRDTAHAKFQEIAFAYAILSDERRRKRYDTTGNTSESIDIEDDDFNWLDFFRAQWAETVTTDKIGDFQSKYQGSDEEKRDVLAAYIRFRGDLNKVFNEVMLSNPLNDEDRFRIYIQDAVDSGEVEGFDAFVNEPESKKKSRINKAKREAQQAEKHAEDLGLNGSKKGGKKGKKDSEADLIQLIQQRNKSRTANFLDDLEAKYAAPKRGKSKAHGGKKKQSSEPPEEAFAQMGSRATKRQAREDKPKSDNHADDDDDDEDEEDDEEEEAQTSEADDFVSEDEEEIARPAKRQKKDTTAVNGKRAKRRPRP